MKKLFIAVAALAIGLSANAQQALWGGPSVESPVINEDGTVTFRFQAPKAIKASFAELGISFDIYSRTSSKEHHETAAAYFKKLYEEGKFVEKVSQQYYDEEAGCFLADRYITGTCPHCGRALAGLRWVNQGDQRYMNLFPCEEHGQFLVRVRFRRNADSNTWCANKLIYEADGAMQEYYKSKSTQSRRRGRGHSSRKNRPASKQ